MAWARAIGREEGLEQEVCGQSCGIVRLLRAPPSSLAAGPGVFLAGGHQQRRRCATEFHLQARPHRSAARRRRRPVSALVCSSFAFRCL
jgi:hypothetical protein